MIELRNQTVENIINASNIDQVDRIIDESIKTLKNNETHDFIIVRFLSKLEMSLKEMLVTPLSESKIENLKTAIRCINKRELNKIISDSK